MDEANLKRFFAFAVLIAATLVARAALSASENFDEVKPGEIPDGWTCGVTGKGSPIWKVEADASAPSSPNVLKQSGSGTFPWCVKQSVRIADGFVEVKFKPLAGRQDRAGGVLWRFKDGNNYYIAQSAAIDSNVPRLTSKLQSRLWGVAGAAITSVFAAAAAVPIKPPGNPAAAAKLAPPLSTPRRCSGKRG